MAKQDDKSQEEQKDKKITVVEYDGIDALMFDSVRSAKKVREICTTETAEGVTQDAFVSFFSHDPKVIENGDMVQSGVVEQMMSLPEFESLRAGTQNDEISSALGAVQFAPDMITKIAELRKKMEERKKQAEQNGDEGPKSLQEGLSEGEMASLRQSLRRGLEKAQEEADQWGNTAKGWGIGPGELTHLPVEKRMELAERLAKTRKLNKIADLAGRFKNIVNASAASVPIHGIDEIVDIGISSDIAHMLPTEMVKLTETPDLFYADLLEGKLLTYNLKGVEPVGRGPIIACVDLSGSMQGGREEWSKAVVLSLLQLAQKQNRAFGFIGFDDRVKFTKFFARGVNATLDEKLEIATVFSGGGTNFYEPLMKAFEMRAKDPTLKPADIIFITDGDCHFSEDQLQNVLEQKKKTDMRVYSIAIDCYSSRTLEQFSDQVAGVSLNGDVQIDLVKDLISKTASQKVGKAS